MLCLDAFTKEYQHLPVKRADLEKLARLEAETVLPEDSGHFVVINSEYGETDARTGRLKSVLYAVSGTFVSNVLKEFRRIGIRICRISSPVSGLMNAARISLRLKPGEQAAAVIDAGEEKLRLLLFRGAVPVFQKEFDSVYGELLDILKREEGLADEEAKREIARPGFLLTTGGERLHPATVQSISLLLETAVGEAIRNARVVLSSERMELGRAIFCGRFASHPDFQQYIEKLGLNLPFEIAGAAYEGSLGITLEPAAAAVGYRPADFLALHGLISGKSANVIDFLSEENSLRGGRRAGILLLAVLTAAAAAAMALQPLLYRQAVRQCDQDQATLSSPDFLTARQAVERRDSLTKELGTAKQDRDALPGGSSSEIYRHVLDEVGGRVSSIQQCSVNCADGSVSLSFTVPGLSEFAAVRDSTAASGYFSVEIPFAVTGGSGAGGYTCTTVLKVKNYKPYEAAAAGRSSSSQSGTTEGAAK